jgi:hypothetical protein
MDEECQQNKYYFLDNQNPGSQEILRCNLKKIQGIIKKPLPLKRTAFQQ